ncbi:hypothetical protein MHUMG1_07673 [Metarhizium humberi]|uniref:Uncharacterized protein n=1 Tax=Metarhizium humberi TaxID=2596975 RepID=A0A9P8M933_9HYPO|nr:hypothetical protein MHUMG1_07673 [Metarhizium humberi]
MFATFKYNDTTQDHDSGVGPGKKRLRKVSSPIPTFNAPLPQKPPPSPSPSLHRGSRPSSSTAHADGYQSRGSPGPRSNKGARMRYSPGTVNTAGRHGQSNQADLFDSPQPWLNLDMEMETQTDAPSDGDDFLTGDGFSLCPAKHTSAVAQPPLADSSEDTAQLELAGRHSSALVDIIGFFDLARSAKDQEDSITNQERPHASNRFLPGGTAASAASSASPARRATQSLSQYYPSFSSSATNLSKPCGCLSSMLQTLEELGTQTGANATVATSDTLFLYLEQGIDKCSTMLSCVTCDTNVSNPILVVTIANQLAAVLTELVHRFIQCQSRDTVPTVFQFGRYSVKQTTMRTRLLKSMIELHVKDLNQLVARLQDSMAGKPGLLLDDAKNKVQEMQQSLLAFSGNANTESRT